MAWKFSRWVSTFEGFPQIGIGGRGIRVQSIYRLPILRFTTLLDSVKPSNLANIWSDGKVKERRERGERVGGALNSPRARGPLNEITGRALPAN